MYCMHCGQALPPEAFFCPHCGAKLPGGLQPSEAERAEANREPAEPPKIDCGLSLSIVAFCLGGVLGIVALIYAILATDKYRSGDYDGARKAAKTGRIWSWTAIVLGAAGLIFGFLLLPRIVELIAPGLLEM
ncbi:MAG: CD225/dispanin family protein [Lentisphaeria bacterium]|nr:CD225/dispanin family protein [Lentisphaeria bacterium]